MAAARGPGCRGPAAGTKRTDLTAKRPEEVERANAAAEAEASNAAAQASAALLSLSLLSGMLSIPRARHLAIRQAVHPREVGVMLHLLLPALHLGMTRPQLM